MSTDDAYVNGDVTYVAPRVNGQVARVLVADNNVVRKGELLLELDSEPYEVQVNIAQAAVDAAKAELITAQAQVCGIEAQAHSLQFSLVHAIEGVHDKTAELRASVAGLDTAKATLTRATSDYQRALAVRKSNEGSDQCTGCRSIFRGVSNSECASQARRLSTSIKFVSASDCRRPRNPRTNLPKYRPTWIKRSVRFAKCRAN